VDVADPRPAGTHEVQADGAVSGDPTARSRGRSHPEPGGLFDDIYRRERNGLVRLGYLLTGSQSVAEDLVQDVFLRVRVRIETVDEPGAYLRRSVTNACWSWHRRRRREDRLAPERPVIVAGTSDIEMWDALARLSPRRRNVLVLRYYLDLPEAEVAEILGWRLGTVKSATHRALQDLKRGLEA
jgi:RNA polymerase sigma-70 factor (sigma-E family)